MTRKRLWFAGAGLLCTVLVVQTALGPSAVQAQSAPPVVVDRPLGTLKGVRPPEPKNLNQFLRTNSTGTITPAARAAAIALGKALFWDQAAGSDGQACASCHFNSGADSRTKNQLNPGFRSIPPDNNFDVGFSAGYQLTVGDFPFHLTRPLTNDIVSSQGVFNHDFGDITLSPCPADQPSIGNICDQAAATFNAQLAAVFRPTNRNVEPRNTPTTINSALNFRNFWDGRARNEFNGVNPIGDLDPFARVLLDCGPNPSPTSDPLGKCRNNGGPLQKIRLNGNGRLEDSSLASQAVGPPLSDLEMSFANRTFAKLGKKMVALSMALPGQMVASDDSVLGPYSSAPSKGISKSYKQLIMDAFQNKWWDSALVITFGACPTGSGGTTLARAGGDDPTLCLKSGTPSTTNQFTQMEYNFSLFWGIAIQMYESTLISDDTPFDRAFASGDPMAFTQAADANGHGVWGDQEKLGLRVFTDQSGVTAGKCIACHSGPELTNASLQNVRNEKLERMIMGNDQVAVYDNGFYNTAVTQCKPGVRCDDIGLGATIGPNNLPLSMSRFFQRPDKCGFGSTLINGQLFTGCTSAPLIAPRPAEGIAFNLLQPNERVAVDGAFKTPGLRNVELTAPFFHNGGDLSLEDVVEFYNRGGNFRAFNQDNLDPDIVPLGLTPDEKAALVAVMKAMTDERVRYQRAPFDHPELTVPDLGTLPAVGKFGSATALHTFLQNLQTTPATP